MATSICCSLMSLRTQTARFPAQLPPSFLTPSPNPPLSLRCGRGGTESLPNIPIGLRFSSPSDCGTAIRGAGFNVEIIVDEDEPEDSFIRRFRTQVLRAGILQESKRRRFCETKQERRKRKSREASRRNRQRNFQSRGRTPYGEEEAMEDDDFDRSEDNWEMIGGEIPV
ncbi:hypothetical protein ACLOJK_033612 [Asimina triloba]